VNGGGIEDGFRVNGGGIEDGFRVNGGGIEDGEIIGAIGEGWDGTCLS